MDAPQLGSQEQASQLIGKIMEKSWADESFKQKLLADATATLIAEGVAIPEGIKVNVVENTGNVLNYVLPTNPAAELSDADLEMVAGGKGKTLQQRNDELIAIHGSAENVETFLAGTTHGRSPNAGKATGYAEPSFSDKFKANLFG